LREALDGAGRTAFQLGRYLEAKRYLARALEVPGPEAGSGQGSAAALHQSRNELNEASRLLVLYPSSRLNLRERNTRILADRKLAMARLAECTKDRAATPATNSTATSAPAPKSPSNPLQGLASRFYRQPSKPAGDQAAAPPPVDPLQGLLERWQQLPPKISLADLEKKPELAQKQIQLIYDTELITQQVCGAPAGDDALLLRIAQAPNQVEEE
jgi:hypothetical protein